MAKSPKFDSATSFNFGANRKPRKPRAGNSGGGRKGKPKGGTAGGS